MRQCREGEVRQELILERVFCAAFLCGQKSGRKRISAGEPEATGCGCALKRIDEDVAEKFDHTPGVLTGGAAYPWQTG
jgi:hypothetical protein